MAPKIQHKRSAVAGKAPLPADLEYGEIAVNYEATDPALYIKDSADAIRKIGNQPAATETAAGIVELATAAETTTGTDATRAVHPAGLKVELDKKAPKTVTSDTAPANPADGDLWYDSVGGELYVWYDSDDAGAAVGTWVQANPQPTPKQATAAAAGVDVKLWKKTGTTLEPETAKDGLEIKESSLHISGKSQPWGNNQPSVLVGFRPPTLGDCGFIHLGSGSAEDGNAISVSSNTTPLTVKAFAVHTSGRVELQDRIVLTSPIGAAGYFPNNAGNGAELQLQFDSNNRMNVIGLGGCGIKVAGWYRISANVLARPSVGGNQQRTDLVMRRFSAASSTSTDITRFSLSSNGESTIGGDYVAPLAANDYITFKCETAGSGDLYGSIGCWSVWYLHG